MKLNLVLKTLLLFLISNNVFSQKDPVHFKQKDLEAYKVNHEVYNFWSQNSNWDGRRGAKKRDSLFYFIDETEYKGLVNYGIDCYTKSRVNCVYNENFIMYNLEVAFETFKFSIKDSVVSITGSVNKGWSKKDDIVWGHVEWGDTNNVNVFIGQKKDTISKIYYGPGVRPNFDIYYKFRGKKFKNFVVLDSFPAFYMDEYVYFETKKGNSRPFEISAKINPNSILTFGLERCYAEVFEIGKLVFDDKKTRKERIKKSIRNQKSKEDFKYIIRNNVQELYKDSISSPKKTRYYQITETAEDYIIKRKYGKAKLEYNKLLKEELYVFSRDVHNALRASVLSRDYKTAVLWCEKLVLKGIPLSYFNAQLFNRFRSTTHWSNFLQKHPLLKEQHLKGLNQTLITGLEELIAMDQKDYGRHAKGEFDSSMLYETTERINDKLIALLLQEGFPTEESIGVEMLNDSIPKTSPEHFVLIAHANQANSSRLEELNEIIKTTAQNGLYDSTRSNLDELMKMGTCLMLYKGNLYNSKSCGSVNKKQLMLIDFSFNNKHGFIVDEGQFAVLAYNKDNEKEDLKFFEERFNFVKKITDDWFEDH